MKHITVYSKDESWEVADKLFPYDYSLSESSSARAGYPIYRSNTSDWYRICDLSTRLELVMGKQEDIAIWIEDNPVISAMKKMGFQKNKSGYWVMP